LDPHGIELGAPGKATECSCVGEHREVVPEELARDSPCVAAGEVCDAVEPFSVVAHALIAS
jgi:hypothetical protein